MVRILHKTVWGLLLYNVVALASPEPRYLPGGVGTGGDLADRLVALARSTLLQTLGKIEQGEDTASLCTCPVNSPDEYCRYFQSLTVPQQDYCRSFILNTAWRVSGLAPNITFSFSDDPLVVPGPDGKPHPVFAVTDPGPSGGITFNYNDVKNWPPIKILELLGHELGHKVWFLVPNYFVLDNPPIGPFNYPGGSRALLNSVGAALAHYGLRHGLVPLYTSLYDTFLCSVTETTIPISNVTTGRSPRLFLDPSWTSYETGVGNLPRDTVCCHLEEGGESAVCLRVQIHEPDNCGPLEDAKSRWTQVELTRSYTLKNGNGKKPSEQLGQKRLAGWSPICNKDNVTPLGLDYSTPNRHWVMEVRYTGVSPGKGSPSDEGIAP